DRLHMVIDIRDPAVKRTFVLMVPVTIGLGLININAVIDQLFATHFLNRNLAPAAIVRAFRLYMLPQGMFSVAVATVLFPLLSPWIPCWVALATLGLNAALDAVFYRFGIWGIPLSTSLVNIAGTFALLVLFRRRMGSFELAETTRSFVLVAVASVALAGVAWGVWHLLDS